MRKFPIEKGITMPAPIEHGRAESVCKDIRATLEAMQAGDSFVIDSHREQTLALRTAQRMGLTVTTRKLNGGGVRVWLVGKVRK